MTMLPRYSPQRLAALAVLSGFEAPRIRGAKILELDPRDVATSVRIVRAIPECELDLLVRDQELKSHADAENIVIFQRSNAANSPLDDATNRKLLDKAPYSFIVAHFPNDIEAIFKQLPGLCGPSSMFTCVTRVLPGASVNRWISDFLRVASPLLSHSSVRENLDLLSQLLANDERPYPGLVKREVDRVLKLSEARMAEFFDPAQKPLLFSEILHLATSQGFTYLGDAEMDSSVLREELMPQELYDQLANLLPTELAQEQFLDSLLFRSIRQPVFARGQLQADLRPLHERLAFAKLSLTVELEEHDNGSLSASAVGLNRFEISDRVAAQALRTIKKNGSIECYRLISQVLESFRIPYGEQLTLREYLVGVIDMYLRLGFLEILLDQ